MFRWSAEGKKEAIEESIVCVCARGWTRLLACAEGGRERAEEKVTMNIIRAEEYIYSIDPHGGLTKTKTLGTSAHNVIPH